MPENSNAPHRIGPYIVSDHSFRAPTRTFALDHIIRLQLHRPFWLIGLALSIAAAGFIWAFQPLLYPYEIAILLGAPAVFAMLGRMVSLMSIEVRGAQERGLVLGQTRHLKAVRDVIDTQLARPRSGIKQINASEDES